MPTGAATILGEGSFRFEVVDDWAQLPQGWTFREVAAVAVARDDRVFVFSRGDHPITIFSPDGGFLGSWGEGTFAGPHGANFAPDGTLYLVDEGDHTVRQYTTDGALLRTIAGERPSAYQSGMPFHRPTHCVADPASGDLYISDGYGNSRVHCYSAAGEPRFSWGSPGTDPGQFHVPHNIAMDRAGRIFVADRENHRVQIFDRQGRHAGQWVNMGRASALWIEQDGETDHVYVAEVGPLFPYSGRAPNLGPRISVYDTDGNCLARLGGEPAAEGPDRFITPHGLAMDSHGDLYVGECSWSTTGRHLDPPRELRSLRKLVRR